MDVVSTDETGRDFCLIYAAMDCFAVHCIAPEAATDKMRKAGETFVGTKGIPHLVTQDAGTTRCPDPLIRVRDTIRMGLETGKIMVSSLTLVTCA